MQIASRKFYLKHSALYLPQCTANGMRNRRLRQPKSITKLAKKRAWEPPGASKIDPKWLPGRSRDISGAPGAIPSLWEVSRTLPESAKDDQKSLPRAPGTSQDHSQRPLRVTLARKKHAPGAFLHRKRCPSGFPSFFLRFFADFW